MANSENTFVLGLHVTWHVVLMVATYMRAAGNSARATFTQHHSLSTQGTVSRHAAISLLIGNLLLTCIMPLTKFVNSGNFKASLVPMSLIPLRDQLYLTAACLSLSLISRDQLCQLAVNLFISLISRDQLCLLALHLSSQGGC
jgi:hypothetical protein